MSEKQLDMMTLNEVAQYLDINSKTLYYWQSTINGPPFVKLNKNGKRSRAIYFREDIEKWKIANQKLIEKNKLHKPCETSEEYNWEVRFKLIMQVLFEIKSDIANFNIRMANVESNLGIEIKDIGKST
jgi:hypothetical protein